MCHPPTHPTAAVVIQHFPGAGLGQAQPRRTPGSARPCCPLTQPLLPLASPSPRYLPAAALPRRSAGSAPSVRPPSSGAGGRRVPHSSCRHCRRPPAGRGEEKEEGDSGAQDCAIGPGAIERPRRPGGGRERPGERGARGEVSRCRRGQSQRPGALRGSAAAGAMSGSALGGHSRGLALSALPPKPATKDPPR